MLCASYGLVSGEAAALANDGARERQQAGGSEGSVTANRVVPTVRPLTSVPSANPFKGSNEGADREIRDTNGDQLGAGLGRTQTTLVQNQYRCGYEAVQSYFSQANVPIP